MGTPCTTAILKKDGTVEQVYINYDGDICWNGAMLLIHYREPEKVKQLVGLGNISSLGKRVNPLTDSHTFDNREKDVTTFYGRDRKESGQNPSKFESYDDFLKAGSFEDFNYLFDEKKKKWFFLNTNSYRIKDASTMQAEVEKPKTLIRLVKAQFNNLNSEFKIDFSLYEKEILAEKHYKQMKKELPKRKDNSKKMKI